VSPGLALLFVLVIGGMIGVALLFSGIGPPCGFKCL
jgi:hypothetical protein